MASQSRPGKTGGYVVGVIILVIALGSLALPFACSYWMKSGAEAVSVPRGASAGTGSRDLEIVTVLSKDAIAAIMEPGFLDGPAADGQMAPGERVIGVSIGGDSRAYPLKMLSRHEIVNDEVGGVPVAVTW